MEYSFIYTLTDPNDNKIKYIGKTEQGLNVRLSDHLKDCKLKLNTKRINWIRLLKDKGQKPIIELLDIVPKSEWVFWEEFYISLFKSWGFKLKNSTNGGEGCSGFKHSIEHREKLKVSGNFVTNNPNKKGSKISEEVIKKIIATKRIKKELGLSNYKPSEETRKKLSERKKQYWADKRKNI